MSEPNGPVCPECGTPRASDGTPACACARRASDARRDARAAERAAAEDFDPVRIRRFVELGDDAGADRNGDGDGDEDAQETRDLADPDADAPPALPPSARTTPDEPPPVDTVDPRSKRRRTLLITGAGATLAVLLTGAFLGGLFTYDSPSRGGAVSDDIREPIPEGSAEDGTAPEGQSSGTASASPSRSESPSPSTTAGDSPATTPSAPATPTASPSSAAPTTSTAPEPSAPEGEPAVLRLGDQGPEVTELQLRLNQIGLYAGDADGTYDRQVESAVSTYQFTRVILSDESGVYGRATRTALESETSEP